MYIDACKPFIYYTTEQYFMLCADRIESKHNTIYTFTDFEQHYICTVYMQ